MESSQRNKEVFLGYLKENGISYKMHEHPPVLTVDEAAQQMVGIEGAQTKNLFLKDKKHRLLVISALSTTKVDLKLMSQRLGLGKGGLRMAPEEHLQTVLQVPPGCVTPFAVFNESARHVGLLLDKKLKEFPLIWLHPLSNDATIGVSQAGLDGFLHSVGRDASYVDLEANVAVGKDQPPDLAHLLPNEAAPAVNGAEHPVEPAGGAGVPPAAVPLATAPAPVTDAKKGGSKAVAAEPGAQKAGQAAAVPGDNVDAFVNKLLELLDVGQQGQGDGVGAATGKDQSNLLRAELAHRVVTFKNSAYSNGFAAGRGSARLALQDP